ncbi:response regulator [Pseudonocardia adelaidensis]|uniref:Response regulator n=1 Tax=Pseudonocardia adelaidensis TaxID=648754 RepID=A0ABP9P2H3_9PSEU
MTAVLVVDDDTQLLRALRIHLAARGYEVHTAVTGKAAVRAAEEHEIDVVVLDLGLPDLDGTEVITALRAFTTVPIIVLSARADSGDKVRALDRGADDYVIKPFGVDELMARLRAAVRRAATTPENGAIDAGELSIDLAAKIVRRSGDEVHLTPTEWSLLDLLVRNRGRLVGRKQLLREIWGPVERKETSYLRVYMAQLRRKLERDPAHPEHLITEAGMGYRFRA